MTTDKYDKVYKAQLEHIIRHYGGVTTKINNALKDQQKDASDGVGCGPSFALGETSAVNAQQCNKSQLTNMANICPLDGCHTIAIKRAIRLVIAESVGRIQATQIILVRKVSFVCAMIK